MLLLPLLFFASCADSAQGGGRPADSDSSGSAAAANSARAAAADERALPPHSARFDRDSYRAGDALTVEASEGLFRISRQNARSDQQWGLRLRFAVGDTNEGPEGPEDLVVPVTLFGPADQTLAGRYVVSPAGDAVTFSRHHTGFPITSVEIPADAPLSELDFDAPVEAPPTTPPAEQEGTARQETGQALTGASAVPSALIADLGHLNFQTPSRWRRTDFELYQWEAVPSILYFDFADYAVQRLMFGRLGFFVAVVGEAGTVRPEEEYEGRHSYNAHDYRPEDLVAFYETAAAAGVALNEYEALLQEILLAYGIIHSDGGRLAPGTGAVVSVAQETWRPLRQRLVRHEALHGLFYAVPEFRDGVFAVWRDQPETLTRFFYYFLGNKGTLDGREGYSGYDVDREYLLVNEAMAHVLQLLPSEVVSYYRYYADRTNELIPESREAVSEFTAELESLIDTFRSDLEAVLEETVGFENGRMLAWYPEGSEILY